MHKKFLITASFIGALAVMLGAFAAHQLKEIVAPDVLQVFETGVKYQVYHAMALLAAGMLYKEFPVKQLLWAGYLFITGIILFSGSLYLLCFIKHQQLPATWVGAFTPLGGLCFIAGWLMMATGIAKKTTAQ
ncbi:MAG: DUF423 domain-containing protein [Chitinophagaceae bacterium]|nr:DUF423 domain-containing protein [Chitinophagaceae bacterium]